MALRLDTYSGFDFHLYIQDHPPLEWSSCYMLWFSKFRYIILMSRYLLFVFHCYISHGELISKNQHGFYTSLCRSKYCGTRWRFLVKLGKILVGFAYPNIRTDQRRTRKDGPTDFWRKQGKIYRLLHVSLTCARFGWALFSRGYTTSSLWTNNVHVDLVELCFLVVTQPVLCGPIMNM